MRSRDDGLVRAGSVADSTAAHVIVARLQAEGIDAHIVSRTSGEFPMTVGNLAEVDIWVQREDLDDTRSIIAAHAGTPVSEGVEPGSGRPDPAMRAVALLTGAALVAAAAWYLLRIF